MPQIVATTVSAQNMAARGRDLLDLLVLPIAGLAERIGLQRQTDVEDVPEQLLERVGMPLDAQRRVLDVAQIAGLLLVHRGLGHEPAQDVREPRGRTPEPNHLWTAATRLDCR